MNNYFILIGPKNDPAEISNLKVKSAFKKIYETKSLFISRGDNSGTDYKEKMIWKSLNLNSSEFTVNWYLETGTSMGATINTAIGLNAYTFTDKATWLSFKNKLDFTILSLICFFILVTLLCSSARRPTALSHSTHPKLFMYLICVLIFK